MTTLQTSAPYLETFTSTVEKFEEYVNIYQDNIDEDSPESEDKIYHYLGNISDDFNNIYINFPGLNTVLAGQPFYQKVFKQVQLFFLEQLVKRKQSAPGLGDLCNLVTLTEEELKHYGPVTHLLGKFLGYADQPISQKIEDLFYLLCSGRVGWAFGDLNLHIWSET